MRYALGKVHQSRLPGRELVALSWGYAYICFFYSKLYIPFGTPHKNPLVTLLFLYIYIRNIYKYKHTIILYDFGGEIKMQKGDSAITARKKRKLKLLSIVQRVGEVKTVDLLKAMLKESGLTPKKIQEYITELKLTGELVEVDEVLKVGEKE